MNTRSRWLVFHEILTDQAWYRPETFTKMVDGAALRMAIRETGGSILACGGLWTIKYRRRAPDLYTIYLERETEPGKGIL